MATTSERMGEVRRQADAAAAARQGNGSLDAALAYAARGWHVIPFYAPTGDRCTCWAPAKCEHPGKHPLTTKGPDGKPRAVAATADPATVRGHFRGVVNVGVRCGGVSRIVVLDVDPRHGGTDSLAALLDAHGPLPDTPEVATGGGGRHYYFQVSSPLKTVPEVAPGVELRGERANVVAPPSLHASGRRYDWVRSPDDIELAPLPAWLAALAGRGKARTNGAATGPIPEGQRHATLVSLAGRLRAGGQDEAAILVALRAAHAARCQPPLSDAELAGIARSVAQYKPGAHLSELGNAQRLVREHGNDLRFCHPRGKWSVWDERRWAEDETGAVTRRAKATVAGIYAEAAASSDADTRKAIAKHAIGSEAERKLHAMIALAKSEPGIPVLPEDLDKDPCLLNVQNGTLDLRTSELRPHRREDLLTRCIEVPYDPSATCPVWLAFLGRVLDDNAQLIAFLKRAVGYSLTGDVSEHVLFFLYGLGANGKTTFLNVLLALLGPYGLPVEPDLLLVRRGEVHPTGLADLEGTRLAVAMEVEDGRRMAESLVKQMTGGDQLTARKMRQDFRKFDPTHKVWLGANHKPVIRGTDNAIWRRIRLVPFNATIPPAQQDRTLAARLRQELPGILAWAVHGCLEWAGEGLGLADEVRAATAAYRSEQDVLAGFLDECCVVQPSASVGSTELADAYAEWSGTPLSQRTLADKLRERGYERHRTKSGVRWLGLGLLAEGGVG